MLSTHSPPSPDRLVQGKSGGSVGLFYGRDSGYWNVGKGSTWEGGIREAAFVNWPGMVAPQTRSSEVCSSLDFLPTGWFARGAQLVLNVLNHKHFRPDAPQWLRFLASRCQRTGCMTAVT